MTCIVGIEHDGDVWIGGDSAGTASNMLQRIRDDKKVFKKDEFLIGFCGSFRMGQLLRCNLVIPKRKNSVSDESYLVNDFVNAVMKCVDSMEGEIMFGYRGKLYMLYTDLQVARPSTGFDSVGSGSEVAMGSLYSTAGRYSPEDRIKMALDASSSNNASVRPPYTIMKLES